MRDVRRQLESGEARIVYDLVEERANIVESRPRR
ncbi:MAG: YheU family protein [Vicinamibacteria bacterium]